jgi:hypothetical protein
MQNGAQKEISGSRCEMSWSERICPLARRKSEHNRAVSYLVVIQCFSRGYLFLVRAAN